MGILNKLNPVKVIKKTVIKPTRKAVRVGNKVGKKAVRASNKVTKRTIVNPTRKTVKATHGVSEKGRVFFTGKGVTRDSEVKRYNFRKK